MLKLALISGTMFLQGRLTAERGMIEIAVSSLQTSLPFLATKPDICEALLRILIVTASSCLAMLTGAIFVSGKPFSAGNPLA